jgi:hypothetical protein
MAKIETFKDNFDFGGRDSGKWEDGGSQINIGTSLSVKITSTTGAQYNTLSSIDTFDLTGSHSHAQLVDAGDQTITSLEVYPVHLANGNNSLSVMISGNVVAARKKINSTSTTVGSTLTYDSATMKWFRIREAAGTTYWEYATDPDSTWTTIASASNPITVTALHVEIIEGTWQAESSTTVVEIDNVNTTPAEYQFGWKGQVWNKRIHAGPAANNQEWNPDNVIESDGSTYLTLQLTSGASYPAGAEIFSEQRGFGYGTYLVVVSSKLTNETIGDAGAFGGLFTFDFTDSPAYREIDMNETRPNNGEPKKQLLKNHAWDNGGSISWITDSCDYDTAGIQTHRMVWESDKITFDSFVGDNTTGPSYFHTVQDTHVPTPGLERIHFNVFVDTSIAGFADNQPFSVAIKDFSFVPEETRTPSKKKLSELEREYFVRKAGGAAPTKPLNQIKREYFIAQTGAAPAEVTLHELELRWLRKVIADGGGTVVSGSSESHLWKLAVTTLSLVPSREINDNKTMFYLNAA